MLYQALLGAWPIEGHDQDFVERMQAYALKAAREGMQQTSWIAPDQDYENGIGDFVKRLLDHDQSADFIGSFAAFARRIALIGALNSLAQVTLKATIAGVPDFYQGTELWDLSLVDPDNRRPVDFAARERALQSVAEAPDWSALAQAWPDGRIKLALTARLLSVRRAFANVLAEGAYRSLVVSGRDREEILAFARCQGGEAILVVVGRRFGRSSQSGRCWPSPDAWDATLSIEGFSCARDLLSGQPPPRGSQIAISEVFAAVPVALLQAQPIPV